MPEPRPRRQIGALPPIFTRQHRLAEDRYLLLGWTSRGSGEQSDHAWIVARDGGALRVASKHGA